MPAVQPTPVAIACADLHLSHKPPAARAGEPDWYAAQKRPLMELAELQWKLKVPVLCAGDVFHTHNPAPELINFAIQHLPKMYAVPGQHDLPYHVYKDIKKSAFWTLVEAGTLVHVMPEGQFVNGVWLQGFGWGQEVKPTDIGADQGIALVHKYIWFGNASYPGATVEHGLSSHFKVFGGYDTVIIGDNHISWDHTIPGTRFFNCGSLMRRNADQAHHAPRVGIVMSDGSVKSHYLDTSQDVLNLPTGGTAPTGPEGVGFAEVMEELRGLGGATLDFPALLRQAMEQRGTDPRVAKYLLEALEHGDPDQPKTR